MVPFFDKMFRAGPIERAGEISITVERPAERFYSEFVIRIPFTTPSSKALRLMAYRIDKAIAQYCIERLVKRCEEFEAAALKLGLPTKPFEELLPDAKLVEKYLDQD